MELGEKEREFLRRIQEGIPAEEAPALLQAVQDERARARAPKTNPSHSGDSRVQRLSDLWFSQRTTATVEQKNRVGLAYIAKVLALGDGVASRFAEGDRLAYHTVGLRQGGVESYTSDFRGFWKGVHSLFPDVYTPEEISFLLQECGVWAVSHFLWQLEVPLVEESPVLRRLHENAHVYK